MLIMLMALGCTHKDHHDDSVAEATATVSFLVPIDDEQIVLGDNTASLLVEGFTLVDVERHNEGTPEGFVRLSLDGVMVVESGLTQLPYTLTEAGEHTLTAELFYSDGDALEPPVSATVTFTGIVE
jgi:hypothetical protein